MDCEILNVMVQPAVENAIFHGIVPKEENCKLKFSVCKEKEHLVVSVEDNGVGMSPETLAEQMCPGHEAKRWRAKDRSGKCPEQDQGNLWRTRHLGNRK
ncbi:MAG: ATP-binding protein [Blautia sp.]